MKQCRFPLYFLALLSYSLPIFAEPIDKDSTYWKCSTIDATHTVWTSESIYQKIALNIAYAMCKKKSQAPTTCKTSRTNCEKFVQGMNVTPIWQCTAFDREALIWKSNFYSIREDAALGAQAYCKQKSPVPDTCYINMLTCTNKNEI